MLENDPYDTCLGDELRPPGATPAHISYIDDSYLRSASGQQYFDEHWEFPVCQLLVSCRSVACMCIPLATHVETYDHCACQERVICP